MKLKIKSGLKYAITISLIFSPLVAVSGAMGQGGTYDKLDQKPSLDISVASIKSDELTNNNDGKILSRKSFDIWRKNQVAVSVDKIFQAMSFADTARGVIVASPSKSNPDYYYHWVRDAGMVMDVVIDLYSRNESTHSSSYIENKINEFILFSKGNQRQGTLTGLGEPKFYVDGSAFNFAWGRPQTDGPALRSLALIKWAKIKLQQGHEDYVRDQLYNSVGFDSVIKADLEYISNNWKIPTYDLWEEVKADHFFTRSVQRAALLEGAELAQALGDFGASDWYLRQASKIESSLKPFLQLHADYILATFNYVEGWDTKHSNLDIAVILGLLRIPRSDLIISIDHEMVIKTLQALTHRFKNQYPINHNPNYPGVAIGRYTEDAYDGVEMTGGNPWVLATMAVAEAYYRIAKLTAEKGQMQKAQDYLNLADSFYQRVQSHSTADYSLAEQIDKDNGYMRGAPNLTWSYSSVLTAEWAREEAVKAMKLDH